jgi:uncharacterized membrane protein
MSESTLTIQKVLVGLFYALQGLIHVWLFFIIRVVGSLGAPGGVLYGLEIMIRSYFVLASCFSLLTVLTLFLKREERALNLGIITLVLFGLFYGFDVIARYYDIARGYYISYTVTRLLLSLIIVVLNVVSVFGLFSIVKEERMHVCIPKDTSASRIPKGRFCKQCGKLISVELSSCPNCGKELE